MELKRVRRRRCRTARFYALARSLARSRTRIIYGEDFLPPSRAHECALRAKIIARRCVRRRFPMPPQIYGPLSATNLRVAPFHDAVRNRG